MPIDHAVDPIGAALEAPDQTDPNFAKAQKDDDWRWLMSDLRGRRLIGGILGHARLRDNNSSANFGTMSRLVGAEGFARDHILVPARTADLTLFQMMEQEMENDG